MYYRNKKGEMSLYTVCFVLVLVIIMFPLFEYLKTYEGAEEIRTKVQTDLNSIITSTGVNTYDKLKAGNFKEIKSVDAEDFETQLGNSLGLTKNLSIWSSPKTDYKIKDLSIQVKNTGHATIVFAQYKLIVPVEMVGKVIKNEEITQTAESYLAQKYYSANQKTDELL